MSLKRKPGEGIGARTATNAPIPRVPFLTPKKRKFLAEYLANGNATESYIRAYGSTRDTTDPKVRKDYQSRAYQTLNSPHTQVALTTMMDVMGISDQKIIESLKKIIVAGVTPEALKQTKPSDTLNALKFASQLKDIVPTQKTEVTQKRMGVNLNLEGKSVAELNDMLAKLSREARDFKKMVEKTQSIAGEPLVQEPQYFETEDEKE